MFRAIIIDDEQNICNLIQILGDWDALSIEVEAIFCDSEDALSFILLHKPEIVITDIKMPVYDGLELIERTRAAGLDSAFIIISGYRHFEYAHKAMQFGIVDYLLKPVNEDELNKTLRKICQSLTDKQREDTEKATYHDLIAEKCTGCHSALLRDLEDDNLTADNLDDFNHTYLTDFTYDHFRVVLLNTSVPQLHISNTSFQCKIEDIAQTIFAEYSFPVSVPDPKGIFCFINYPASKSSVIFNDISRFFSHISALSDIYGSFSLSFGVGDEVVSFLQLRNSYLASIEYEKTKLLLGWDRILSYLPSCLTDRKISQPSLTENDFKNFFIYLESHNTDMIRQWFENWKSSLGRNGFSDIQELFLNRSRILALTEKVFPEYKDNSEITVLTDCARNIPDFLNKLQKHILTIVEDKISENTQLELLPIRRAKEYVKSHYALPITLEEVADFVKYNPSYLSTAFKKHTGQNFSEYLSEVRMEEAKLLLRTSQLSIMEISEKIGYSDSKYFRKLFKKLTGIKPSDYRKLYQ